jgi:hypothetical protein
MQETKSLNNMPLKENPFFKPPYPPSPNLDLYVETTKGKIKKAIPFFGERTDPEITLQQKREFIPSYGTSPMKPKNPIQWSKEEY